MIFCDFWPQLEQEMKTLAAEQQNGVLKVVISRGSGGRGYSTLNSGPATRILSVTVYPAHYDRLRNEGMTLALSRCGWGAILILQVLNILIGLSKY